MFPNNLTLQTRWPGRRDLVELILTASLGDPISGRMPSEDETPVFVTFDDHCKKAQLSITVEKGSVSVRISPIVFFQIQSMAFCVVLCDFVRPFPSFFLGRGFTSSEADELLTALSDPDQGSDLLSSRVGEAFERTSTSEPWTRISRLGSESDVISQLSFFHLLATRLHEYYVMDKYPIVERATGLRDLKTAVYTQCAQTAGATLADRVDVDLGFYRIDPRSARYSCRANQMAQWCGIASAIACDIDASRAAHDASERYFINSTILPKTFRDELAIRLDAETADGAYIAFLEGQLLYQKIRRATPPSNLDETAVKHLLQDLASLTQSMEEEVRRQQGSEAVDKRISDMKSANQSVSTRVFDRAFRSWGPFEKYKE